MKVNTILVAGFVALAISLPVTCGAQPAPMPPTGLATARVSVASASGEPLVSVAPGAIGCRSLISEIARHTRLTVRNLATVPDDVVFVQMQNASLPDAVGKVLRLAKVDYLLREGSAGGPPWLLMIAGSRGSPSVGRTDTLQAGSPSLGAQPLDGGAGTSFSPPPVELPAVEAPDDGAAPAAVPLDVHPEVVEIGPAPTWQPMDATPAPVAVPSDMVPRPFTVTAPPAPTAPVGLPSPPPARGMPAPAPSPLPPARPPR